MALQHLRSSTANKRPTPTSMADGQVALNTAAVSPGVFFKDAGGSLVKVGPVHVGTTAPNVSPAVGGHAGNSVGEQWLDTTGGTYVFKVWDGSAWRSETGTFVDVNGDVMTGALGIIAGTAAASGLYFSGDTNTGIYSPGADQLAVATNGTQRLTVDTAATTSTLPVVHPLGAVGTPSITFTGDLNTGIYSPGADQVAISTNGTGRLFVDASGQVGIGSAPSALLDLAASNDGATGTTANNTLRFTDTDANTAADQPIGKIEWYSADTSSPGARAVSYIMSSAAGANSGGDIRFGISANAGTVTEAARLTSAGLLGLGTSSPDRLLHVSAADTAYIRLENQDSTGSVDQYVGLIEFEGQDSGGSGVRAQIGGIYEGVSGATALVFGTSADAGSVTERLRINRNGNVGIGTTSPSAPLEVTSAAVNGVASEGIRIHMPGSFGGGLSGNSLLFTAQDSGSSNVIYSSIASLISSNTAGSHAGILTFNTVLGGTNTERARITSAGRLGIGTASPGATLHVAGECVLGDNGTNGRLTVNTTTSTVGLFATTTGFGAYEDLELRGAVTIFKRDGTNESARIDSSGRVGIGTTSPGFPLDVNGTGSFTGSLRATSTGTGTILPAGVSGSWTGSGFALQSEGNTAPIGFLQGASERARIDSSGRLLVGTSTSAGTGALLQTRSDSFGAINQENFYSAANAGGPNIIFAKSRGSAASPSVVSADDFLGIIRFRGHDGTDYNTSAAEITVQVDGTPGANDMPGRLVFSTTADGASSPTERMRITNAGKVIINDTSAVLGAPLSSVAQASVSAAAFRSDASTTFAVLTLWGNETSGDQLFVRLSTDSNTLRGSISYNRGGGVVAYNTTSDYRSKTILGNIENTGATIDAFKVYRGVMNGATIERPMMIAHEAQVAAPYCVTGEKDAVDDNGNPIYQQMDHQVLVPLLIAEIQQLRNRVAALEAS